MSFIYPRRISVYRDLAFKAGATGLGAQPYQEPQTVNGVNIWAIRPVFRLLACSIQEYRSGQRPEEKLPGSTPVTPTWKIYMARKTLPNGSILVHDFIMDDLGIKYQVIDPYWNSLGYRLYASYLET